MKPYTSTTHKISVKTYCWRLKIKFLDELNMRKAHFKLLHCEDELRINQFLMNYECVTKANCQCMEFVVNKFVNWRYELAHRQLWVLKQFHWKESDSYGSQGKQVPNRLNQDWSILVSWIHGNTFFFTISNHKSAVDPNCKAH